MSGDAWPWQPLDTAVAGPAAPMVDDVPDGAGGRRRWVVAVLVGLLVAAGLSAVVGTGDWVLRVRELDATLDAVERSEDAMRVPARRLEAVIGQCAVDPACDPQTVQKAALGLLTPIIVTGDAVRTVKVAAWHREIVELRNRYEDHSLAWQVWLQQVVADPIASLDAPNEINETFAAAAQAALVSVPTYAPGHPHQRIDRIFRSALSG